MYHQFVLNWGNFHTSVCSQVPRITATVGIHTFETCTFVSETHGDSMETYCECYKNCEEYTYKNDVSFTQWPRDTVKDQVYYEFFKENEYFLNKVRKVLNVTL